MVFSKILFAAVLRFSVADEANVDNSRLEPTESVALLQHKSRYPLQEQQEAETQRLAAQAAQAAEVLAVRETKRLAAAETPSGQSVYVIFKGQTHKKVANNKNPRKDPLTATAEHPNGIPTKHSSFLRPEWLRTMRCHNNSETSCEPCWGSTNCWSMHKEGRMVNTNSDATTSDGHMVTRYLDVIHLQCQADAASYRYEACNVQHGTVRLFFDGKEVTAANHFKLYTPKIKKKAESPIKGNFAGCAGRMTAILPLTSASGHHLTVEFRPDAGEAGSARMKKLGMFVSEAFQQCADSGACLEHLAGSGATELRQNNAEQLACLLSPKSTGPCAIWKSCLHDSGHLPRLIGMLQAAQGSDAPVEGKVGAQGGCTYTAQSSELGFECRTPPNEDPESWDCDCFAGIEEHCNQYSHPDNAGYTNTRCFRTAICNSAGVCDSWKEANCCGDNVMLASWVPQQNLLQEGHHSKLKQNVHALLQRSSASSDVDTDRLDESLSTKCL